MSDALLTGSVVILTYLTVVPALTLVHELAHAAVAIALLPGTTTATLGTDPRWNLSIGRLRIRIDPFAWRTWWPGFFGTSTARGGYSGAAIALIGPVSSLAAGTILFVAASNASGPIVIVCLGGAQWAFVQFLATAVPMTYPGWMPGYAGLDSDGKRALRYLRARSQF